MPSERVQRRIDRLLDQADEAFERDAYQEALERARDVVALDADNAEAQAFISMAERRIGDGSNAETAPTDTENVSTESSSTPASFADGRYAVSRLLGEGGKKLVYLAHDSVLDRDIAFAVIKTDGLDDIGRERVLREAQAMGRMGTHPCIMPIYDFGEENGQPFMVQPLMSGGDVEELIEDADGPLPLEQAIRIASQTAQGLVFAHSKGIIHRDLKPGNIWLDENGDAKIGDFGLAIATDRSRLTVEKLMVGTVNYMPPEQATGGEVTPRADFYSLGAMLYEMSTGRVPFMGDDDIAVISQHVNTPPVAPSWHNPNIPRTLDSLIIRLLSKDPDERPESADEVLQALGAVDLSVVEETEQGQGSLDSMAGGVFVGRQREMDKLKSIFEEVLSGKGRMVTLVGEPGIGKTRTAEELATYAGMRGAQVLWGRSYESGGAPPYWPWVQVIRSHVASTEAGVLRSQMGSTASVIGELVADVKEKLPDLPEPTPIDDPESARFRLFDSISTFLKNAAASQPLVVMLEDLHWSDKPSLMLLEFIARELANSKIMIIGNYRDMELNRRHPLSVTLGDLTRERLFERVLLRGLQRHDVERFIEIAAGITPPSALVEAVYTQTEGNPLFVTETVRLLIQEGDISAGRATKGGTTSWEIRIPEGVREVIGRRLDRLSERCNEVLTIAAVIGRQFRFDVLKQLVKDTTEGQLLDALDESLSARIVEEVSEEVGFYQFTHASMQETLTEELSHTRAVRMHARIAEALEKHYGAESENHAVELVSHFMEAETVLGVDKFVQFTLAAGDNALASYAYEEAEYHYARGKATHEKRDQQRARLALGHALAMMATLERTNMQKACDSLIEAYEIFEEIGSGTEQAIKAVAAFPLIPIQGVRGMFDLYQRASRSVNPNSHEYIDILIGTAHWAQYEMYDEEMATKISSEAIELSARADDELRTLRALISRVGSITKYRKDPDSATQIEELVSRVTDPITTFAAAEHLFNFHVYSGNMAKAKYWAEYGVKAAITGRNRWTIAAANSGLIQLLVISGQIEQAKDKSREIMSQVGNEARLLAAAFYAHALSGDTEYLKTLFADWEQTFPEGSAPGAIYGSWISILATWIIGTDYIDDRLQKVTEEYAASDALISPHIRYQLNTVLGLSAVFRDDREKAVKIYELIRGEALVPQGITAGAWLAAHGPALLAAYLGHDQEAEDMFVRALERADLLESPTLRAFILGDYTAFLFKRSQSGDRDKASTLQDEAIAIATKLGMQPLLERVLGQREFLKA